MTSRVEAAVRVLAGDVADLGSRLDRVKETADSALGGAAAASRAVIDLTETVRAVSVPPAAAPDVDDDETEPTVSWLLVDDVDQAAALMTDLCDWLGAVYGRWRDGQLRECWAWHPPVVAELVALRDAWTAAYEGERASPAAVMDWLDRHRPGVVRRVSVELEGCSLPRHSADGDLAYRPPRVLGVDQAAELARWWAATHGTSGAPSPIPAMLAEYRARVQEQRR